MERNRREFINCATAMAAGAALQGLGGPAAAAEPGTGVPLRPLGRTGQKVSMLALGGWHIGAVRDEADAV